MSRRLEAWGEPELTKALADRRMTLLNWRATGMRQLFVVRADTSAGVMNLAVVRHRGALIITARSELIPQGMRAAVRNLMEFHRGKN